MPSLRSHDWGGAAGPALKRWGARRGEGAGQQWPLWVGGQTGWGRGQRGGHGAAPAGCGG